MSLRVGLGGTNRGDHFDGSYDVVVGPEKVRSENPPLPVARTTVILDLFFPGGTANLDRVLSRSVSLLASKNGKAENSPSSSPCTILDL